jgi:CheY-like chemotaxis protein
MTGSVMSPQAPALRLLVVDDDEAIQRLMGAIFIRRGVTVDSAADGAAALDLLRHEHYDAIVLDLMLPGTNGFDVIRELKATDPELLDRTIILTAASNHTLRDFDDGRLVRRLIRKPFDIDDFVGEVLACKAATSLAS